MERTEVLDMMGELKLYGMKAAYDETLAVALKRQHEPQRFVGDLLHAEISEKQARSIKYQLAIAKLPLAKDIDDFAFKDTPVNEALVRDLRVAQGRVHAVVAEHRRDRLQAHPAVDRLGRQGVPHLVGVDVADAGVSGGFVEVAGDAVPVDRSPVFPGQQQRIVRRDVLGAVVADQVDQVRVQRQVTVVVQSPDRDVQPAPDTYLHDRVGLQADQFADSQPGADQHFADDTDQQSALGGGGAQELRGRPVVECFG